jgi:hypothetical protein
MLPSLGNFLQMSDHAIALTTNCMLYTASVRNGWVGGDFRRVFGTIQLMNMFIAIKKLIVRLLTRSTGTWIGTPSSKNKDA